MTFIVFLTETVISHVFHELQDLLSFITQGGRYHRIEVWNKNKMSGLHIR